MEAYTIRFSVPNRGSHVRKNLTEEAAKTLARLVRRDGGESVIERQSP